MVVLKLLFFTRLCQNSMKPWTCEKLKDAVNYLHQLHLKNNLKTFLYKQTHIWLRAFFFFLNKDKRNLRNQQSGFKNAPEKETPTVQTFQ